jgi:hypothetical protein
VGAKPNGNVEHEEHCAIAAQREASVAEKRRTIPARRTTPPKGNDREEIVQQGLTVLNVKQ